MEIDVRQPVTVKSIRFGDSVGGRITKSCIGQVVNVAGDDCGDVDIQDIDNLILALQKAKELWV